MNDTSGLRQPIAAELNQLIGQIPGATPLEQRPDGLWMMAPALDVVAMAEAMRSAAARLSTITGLTGTDGETTIVYHYCLGAWLLNIRTTTRSGAIPSIAAVTKAADWAEREIGDLYGVSFVGHPSPGRLLRPPALSPGFFRTPRGEGDGGG